VVHQKSFLPAAVFAAMLMIFSQSQAQAQGNGKDWFIPHPAAPAAPHRPANPASASPAITPPTETPAPQASAVPPENLNVQLPPAPPVPDVPHGTLPPATVVGVLSVPDVLRASLAYQTADKVIAERRQKLTQDAEKEQARLQTLGQQLATERSKLSPEQIRAKEKALQDQFAQSRRTFTERNRIIQEQGQYALLQIQRTLSEVVQKVAASRGMNLVLQRAEVAVNLPEFDITPQVTEVLNRALPTVVIPAEGVSPVQSTPVAAADQVKKASDTKKQ
jgi:Skp family chaperone for outer membrane proteins